MKLKVRLLPRCPECGRTMQVVKVPTISSSYIFKYCPNSECRYCEVEE